MPTPVQTKHDASGVDFTLDGDPTPGNTVTITAWYRSGADPSSGPYAIDGFTLIDYAIAGLSDQNSRVAAWYRHVQPGDVAAYDLPPAYDTEVRIFAVEWPGVWTPVDSQFISSDNDFASPWPHTLGTVTTDGPALLVGAFCSANNVTDPQSAAPDDDSIEQLDTFGLSCAGGWQGYRDESIAGLYDMDIVATNGGSNRGIASFLVAYSGEEPPVTPGTDVDIFDPEFVSLGSIDDATKKEIRVELQGTGQGKVWLRRDSPNADPDLIQRGNWVKITIPQIWSLPIFLFRIETIETTVIDENESGGEEVCFGGRGALVYFESYVAWNESFVVPAGKDSNGGILHGPAATGNKAGQILRRMIEEAQHEDRGVSDFGHRHQPLQFLTFDFDYDDDSDGNTWATTAMTEELSQGYVGDTGLQGIMELIATDEIDITVQPWEDDDSVPLRAYNSYGRDLTGTDFATDVVRFVRAVNIAQKLKSSQGTTVDPNIMLVQGQENVYGYAENHDDIHVEGFASTFGTDTGALDAIGLAEIARRIRVGQSVAFKVTVPMASHDPDPLSGLYLPGPEGSNGHWWIGDTVTLDTGTGFGDFENTSVRVMAITITHTDADDLIVIPEVRGTLLMGRLRPTTGSRGGGSSGTATGGTSAPVPPPPGAIATAHLSDPTDAHDASAISVVPFGTIAATNVQDALEEVVAESGGGGGGGFDVTPPLTIALPPWVDPTGSGVITAHPVGRITAVSGSGYKAFIGAAYQAGRLHLVYRHGSAHNSDSGTLNYTYSDNLGQTWASPATIITPVGDLDVRDPFVTALSTGRLLVGYDLREYDDTPDTITAHLIYSDDRGLNWSTPYTIPNGFGMSTGDQAIVSSPAIELPDGRVLIPGFGLGASFYESVIWLSEDMGETVSDEITVASTTRDYEELQVRYLATGEIVALMRDSVGAHTWRSESSPDDITTWTAPADVLTMTGRPDFNEFYPGALFMMGRSASPNFAPRWTVSWNAGTTWTALQEVDTGETDEQEYAAIVTLAPGFVAAFYSLEDGSDAHIYLRYYYDGYGIDHLGAARFSGLFLNGVEFDDTDPDDGEVWTYDAGSGTYVLATPSGGNPADDAFVWMPLTTIDGGEPVLVWDGDDNLIPTLTPI